MLRKLLISAVLCLVGATAAQPAIFYVDADAPGPTHNGSSWATAYRSVGQAVGSTPAGCDIFVAEGIYRESVAITSNKRLYGGFLGHETSLVQRMAGAFRTVIDPGSAGRGIDVGYGVYATIDGFTIRNGKADKGAGIRCGTDTTTQILNCRIERCVATQWGGGIYTAPYSYGNINDCIITDNRAPNGGGTYVEYHSYPVLRRCVIVRNHATVSGGGAFGPYHAGPDFENCTIAFNSAEVSGGGAYDYYGSPMILNYCIVAFNSAPVGGGLFGGGSTSALTYSHCDLYGNEGGDIGGVIRPASPAYGNISADPLFLFPGSDEFRLRNDSPCAGIGAYPLGPPYDLDRVGIAKLLPDGTPVKLNCTTVTCVDGDTVYLQSPDRSAVIAVQGLVGRSPGDLMASVTGVLGTSLSGERVLTTSASVVHASGVHFPKPLGMPIRSLPAALGLHVKTWGRVTEILPDGFTLFDGVASVPIRWSGAVSDGSLVSVRGVYTIAADLLASELVLHQ